MFIFDKIHLFYLMDNFSFLMCVEKHIFIISCDFFLSVFVCVVSVEFLLLLLFIYYIYIWTRSTKKVALPANWRPSNSRRKARVVTTQQNVNTIILPAYIFDGMII